MSPQKQHIQIAFVCGWENISVDQYGVWGRPPLKTPETGGFAIPTYELPNYTKDLNAIQEAEDVLEERLAQAGYMRKLAEVCYRDWPKNRDPIRATAAQRAEAILVTLNLWTV